MQRTDAMVRIKVENMTCGGCAKGVTATLKEAAPGKLVALDLEKKEITVASDDVAPLLAALKKDGWEAQAA
jgi:copper chaperone